MTPEQAIEAAELTGAETVYRHQLAREAYEAGHADGYRAGYRQADADQASRWRQIARAAMDGPTHAELEERRWGPGGRARFADPRPGDFPGLLTQDYGPGREPQSVRDAWDRHLQGQREAKQEPEAEAS
jgi:hypothetical protein